jgi:hypothetical protein
MSRVGEGTNGNTGAENGGVLPDCVDDYQCVNSYFAEQSSLFVLNVAGVFKHAAEFCVLSTSHITATFRILLTADITDFCTKLNFEYC